MPDHYTRCIYTAPDTGMQCDVWFKYDDQPLSNGNMQPLLCALHVSANGSANLEVSDTSKQTYIDKMNEHMKLVAEMTIDQIEVHIAEIEQKIEDLRRDATASRAVRSQKLERLTESEREERRKIKVERAVRTEANKTKAPSEADKYVETLKAKGLDEKSAKAGAKFLANLVKAGVSIDKGIAQVLSMLED